MSDKQNFPWKMEIIIPSIKVAHFAINFTQNIYFSKTSRHISQRILTVGKDNHMLQHIPTYTFTKYTFVTYVTNFQVLFRFTYVKIIKDYSLTLQWENITSWKRSAQCRTQQYICITLKKIEPPPQKKLKILTKKLLKKHRCIYIQKKDIKTQLCTVGKTFPLFSSFVR